MSLWLRWLWYVLDVTPTLQHSGPPLARSVLVRVCVCVCVQSSVFALLLTRTELPSKSHDAANYSNKSLIPTCWLQTTLCECLSIPHPLPLCLPHCLPFCHPFFYPYSSISPFSPPAAPFAALAPPSLTFCPLPLLIIWKPLLLLLSCLTTNIPKGFPAFTDFTSTFCSSPLVHTVLHRWLISHFSFPILSPSHPFLPSFSLLANGSWKHPAGNVCWQNFF